AGAEEERVPRGDDAGVARADQRNDGDREAGRRVVDLHGRLDAGADEHHPAGRGGGPERLRGRLLPHNRAGPGVDGVKAGFLDELVPWIAQLAAGGTEGLEAAEVAEGS